MNYQLIYDQLINRAKNENRKKDCGIYFEKHHIIPKCIGGDNKLNNLVLLTAREHFIAHKLLYNIYPDDDRIYYALWRMSNPGKSKNQNRCYIINSKEYERYRNLFIEKIRSQKLGKNRKPFSKNHCKNLSKSKLGHDYGMTGKHHSEETKKKMSITRQGQISGMKGKKHSEVTKEKIRQSMLTKKK